MSEIALLHIGRITPDPAWTLPGAVHDHHELIVARAGAMIVRDRAGRAHRLAAGGAALYPAGVWHAETSDPLDPVVTVHLGFRAPLVEHAVTLRADRDGRLATLAEWLWARRWLEDETLVRWRAACLELLLAEWNRLGEHAARGEPDDRLGEACLWLAGRLGEPTTLNDLRRRTGWSASYLLQRFKRRYGLPPMAYLARLRCREAERLLLYTSLPIKRIAEQTGFADPYHFSKAFKRLTGRAPSAVRAEAGERRRP